MSEQLIWLGIAVGGVIIAGLLLYIKKQYAHLEQLKQEQEALKALSESKQDSLRLDVVESLKVIATVMLDDQVELSEGCIRIKVLLDNLDPSINEQDEFKVFADMANQLAHMPTHEARKQVDKQFIRKLDQQRFGLENKYRTDIRKATKALLEWLETRKEAME